jgi:RHS repeat-associated protein
VNRTSKRVNAGTPVEYCYDHADRLTSASDPLEPVSVAAGTLAYDSHGNTSRLGDEVHTYDVAGRHVRTGPAPGASGVPTVAYVRDASNGIVSRSVDGVVSGRYGSTVAGAPSVVLNASNQPISATVGLLGGVSHSYDPTVAAVNGSWHHPNLTGHRVAVTNTSGAKVGSTTVYDPDGMLVAGVLPDDKPGSFDAAWHGGGGVNLEHQAGVHPMVQMGARQYSPILARFLSVDPVEGGSANDYEYAMGDCVNNEDLDGRMVKFKWPRCWWEGVEVVLTAAGIAVAVSSWVIPGLHWAFAWFWVAVAVRSFYVALDNYSKCMKRTQRKYRGP